MQGIVIRTTGNSYGVLTDIGIIDCYVKGNFRIKGIRATNPVAIGDHVQINQLKDGTNWITDIQDRKNYIIRRSTNLSKQTHIIAANIDLAVLIVTYRHPETSTTFIDRFLATAEAYNITTRIVFNKVDLLSEEEQEALEQLRSLYQHLGYQTMVISATQMSDTDKEAFVQTLPQITLFSGNSGVGKSALINKLLGEEKARTGAISQIHDKGMHTTTFSEMYQLPDKPDSWIIDTPGIKGFGTVDMKPTEVSHYFKDIFKLSEKCKYSDCTHTGELGCYLPEALQSGELAFSRYSSYLSIIDDYTENKYRK